MEKELIRKYLAGKCTEAEKKQIGELFSSGKFENEFSELSSGLWEQEPPQVSKEGLQQLLRKIKHDGRFQNKKRKLRFFPVVHYWQVAAVFAIIICSVWLVNELFLQKVFSTRSFVAAHVLRTAVGQKRIIHLPDGSVAHLNSDSELRFANNFSENRQLELVGEAYFRVKKDNSHPFVVQAGTVETQVTGTAFNLFNRESGIAVALQEGAVEVKNTASAHQVQLVPGQQAVLSGNRQHLEVSGYEAIKVLGWKDGTLYFEGTPLSEVMQMLGSWYNVKLELPQSFPGQMKFNGEFNNENLESIISGICYALDLKYEIKGKTVIIKT